MEYFDIIDENGQPTGKTVSRELAHRDGVRHRTAHVWIIRRGEAGYDILLQKRSRDKDSFPGLYDTSSAGHIPAGDEPMESALRELDEELGLRAEPEQLRFAGRFWIEYTEIFHGRPFHDNEVTWVYVYQEPLEIACLTLQASELEEVRWFNLEEVWQEVRVNQSRFCMPIKGLQVLRSWLGLEPFQDGPASLRAEPDAHGTGC